MSVHHDIQHLKPLELNRLYGIEVHENGAVEDTTSGQWFDSLTAWANFEAEQQDEFGDDETMEKFHRGGEYWD